MKVPPSVGKYLNIYIFSDIAFSIEGNTVWKPVSFFFYFSSCFLKFSVPLKKKLRKNIFKGVRTLLVQFSLPVVSSSLRLHVLQAPPASLSITNSRSLPKLMSIESVMPSNHLILCRPLLFPPSIFPSIRVFSSDSVL